MSLSDLRTESDHVRGRIADYLNDLLSIGVDGFRVDAAKHIGSPDLKVIKGKLSTSAYVYQEVMPVHPRHDLLAGLGLRHAPGVVRLRLQRLRRLAPSDSSGHVSGTNCSSGWQGCLDRRLGGMVGRHNVVKGTSVTGWWSDGANQIAFGRGAKGYVAINNSGSTLNRTFATGLPAGTYCDVVGGGVSGGTCTGTAVTVDGSGNATFHVSPGGPVAIAHRHGLPVQVHQEEHRRLDHVGVEPEPLRHDRLRPRRHRQRHLAVGRPRRGPFGLAKPDRRPSSFYGPPES